MEDERAATLAVTLATSSQSPWPAARPTRSTRWRSPSQAGKPAGPGHAAHAVLCTLRPRRAVDGVAAAAGPGAGHVLWQPAAVPPHGKAAAEHAVHLGSGHSTAQRGCQA